MSDTAPLPLVERIVRKVLLAIGVLVLVALLAGLAFAFWASMVMRGDRQAAIEAWENDAITITSTDRSIIMTPAGGPSETGLVFVPGARVDPYAYLYKLSGIVEESGVTVVITKPTLNLAVLDQRPIGDFTADMPEVQHWSIGGHSMGGVRACAMAEGADVAALVLFGAFCANDLSGTAIPTWSIGGSLDGITKPSDIEANAGTLPSNATFIEIEGLNHALFGDYGAQAGDNPATITTEEARRAITEALIGTAVGSRD